MRTLEDGMMESLDNKTEPLIDINEPQKPDYAGHEFVCDKCGQTICTQVEGHNGTCLSCVFDMSSCEINAIINKRPRE